MKFTTNGSISVQAEFIKDTQETGTLSIRVTDTGIGISPEDMKTLFQPFAQASAIRGTATAKNGTGLGLALCKQLLTCMNGDLMVESAVGKGSTFTAVIHQVKYKDHTDSKMAITQEISPQTPLHIFSGLSVLIVDDVPMNLKVLEAMLKRLGIVAVSATSAKEALEKIAKQKFDIVLTDLWMPGLNGVELARAIRNTKMEPMPRLAVITADIEGREHFDFSLFDGVLTKPVTTLAIQRFIESEQKN